MLCGASLSKPFLLQLPFLVDAARLVFGVVEPDMLRGQVLRRILPTEFRFDSIRV
jgi:hypothetical protein